MIETPTVIIGAGPAGLAMAGRLRQRGLDFEVLEKSDRVGNSWVNHYERLHLHTVKRLSSLPGLPFPSDYPRYVARSQLVQYFEDYAERFDITPYFDEEVRSIEKEPSGTWITATSTAKAFRSRNVVVATGVNRSPNRPALAGEELFSGRLVHSQEYRNATPYRGQRVLVVGMGNTGAEIALDLCENGATAAISVRSPVNIVPRDVLGRPTQLTAIMLSRLPVPIGDRLGVLLRKLTVGDLSRYGIATPSIPPAAQLRELGKTPVIDVGALAQIKAGKIRVFGGIDHLELHAVVFEDGARAEFDSIILATGYRPALADFLPDLGELVDHEGVPTAIAPDGERAGLFFLGFDNHRPGGVLGAISQDSASIADMIAG